MFRSLIAPAVRSIRPSAVIMRKPTAPAFIAPIPTIRCFSMSPILQATAGPKKGPRKVKPRRRVRSFEVVNQRGKGNKKKPEPAQKAADASNKNNNKKKKKEAEAVDAASLPKEPEGPVPGTKETVHDLETFMRLIGRRCVELTEEFDNDLETFLRMSSAEMKEKGIDARTRRYLINWRYKFVHGLEPLRTYSRGRKKNGGERKERRVLALRRAMVRLEEKEKWAQEELEAERKGLRVF
ncbi:Protein FYV4, mitochondrial [Candida viswanathii]|uniref:Small ribosomal subunit protein mS41 n=1 Tax=Candida viswanathii TaxID=5486 RepID=A0A367Y4P1_9ASCO|nr:Protein FYV4, mitochondrial [Candida viswanathii]